jgi:hypothetical protein
MVPVLWPQFLLIAACCRVILVLSPVLAFWDCRQRQVRTIIATRTALAKCPSENWPSWLKKMAVIRALSLELSRVRPLTFGNVAQFAGA